ncbi:hypothetical protein SEA_MARSHAWN_78 [Mycobacterium phage Marshawn]|uniref:Uncharacterized protein n=1 Tax=Mycobacterium phage Marshawn TaxID=2652423 RepID=A0A5P8D756_9CAUD|nr:hypothetical protein I5H02_gp21 [Mycobacterium phage Marshawn]QFP94864.1 hypothetical protein SEA_MARSHAWN_78 [Mycobacterium phage Marshawn]
MNRHVHTQPELFADEHAVEVEVYERPDGTRYRVERPARHGD